MTQRLYGRDSHSIAQLHGGGTDDSIRTSSLNQLADFDRGSERFTELLIRLMNSACSTDTYSGHDQRELLTCLDLIQSVPKIRHNESAATALAAVVATDFPVDVIGTEFQEDPRYHALATLERFHGATLASIPALPETLQQLASDTPPVRNVGTNQIEIAAGKLLAYVQDTQRDIKYIEAMNSKAKAGTAKAKDVPTYNGKTFGFWLQQLNDRKPEMVEEAAVAVGVLGVDEQAKAAASGLLKAFEVLYDDRNSAYHRITGQIWKLTARRAAHPVLEGALSKPGRQRELLIQVLGAEADSDAESIAARNVLREAALPVALKLITEGSYSENHDPVRVLDQFYANTESLPETVASVLLQPIEALTADPTPAELQRAANSGILLAEKGHHHQAIAERFTKLIENGNRELVVLVAVSKCGNDATLALPVLRKILVDRSEWEAGNKFARNAVLFVTQLGRRAESAAPELARLLTSCRLPGEPVAGSQSDDDVPKLNERNFIEVVQAYAAVETRNSEAAIWILESLEERTGSVQGFSESGARIRAEVLKALETLRD